MLSTTECAKQLGMSYGQLRRLAMQGKVPFITISNGTKEHRRFDPDEVKAALKQNRIDRAVKLANVKYERPVPCTKKNSTYLQRLKMLQERMKRDAI